MKITKEQFQVGSIFKMRYNSEEVEDTEDEHLAGKIIKNEKGEDILFMLTDIEEDFAWGDDTYVVNLEALNCDRSSMFGMHWFAEDFEETGDYVYVQ